jgi:hypothetical protein
MRMLQDCSQLMNARRNSPAMSRPRNRTALHEFKGSVVGFQGKRQRSSLLSQLFNACETASQVTAPGVVLWLWWCAQILSA